MEDSFTKISESRLLDEPGLQPLRNELLEEALRYYQQFLSDRGDDPQVRAEVASAYLRLSQLQSTIGQTDESLVSLKHGLDLVEQAFAAGLDVRKHAGALAGFFRGPRYERRAQAPPSNPLTAFSLIKKGSQIWEKLVIAGTRRAGIPPGPGRLLFLSGHGDLQLSAIAPRRSNRCARRNSCSSSSSPSSPMRSSFAKSGRSRPARWA